LLSHPVDYALAKKALTNALDFVIAAEQDITKYDTIVGDGDCGIGLKRGAEGLTSFYYWDAGQIANPL
jgi:triose/dihydroxyacetone kinase / FAD-AMP lyase (cyclizing)